LAQQVKCARPRNRETAVKIVEHAGAVIYGI